MPEPDDERLSGLRLDQIATHVARTPNAGNLAHTALRAYTEFPDEDSPRQAALAAATPAWRTAATGTTSVRRRT